MKRLTAAEIRQMYLDFFVEKGHMIEPSAPLVPIDDDSLLWINSGVATLKKYFDGRVIPANPRITNAQKSIRTNDIENVGFTARHHTFFEMLGNFSIGDYFKKEAVAFAWEFLTSGKWLAIEPEKLYVTIHPEDTEAYDIWVNDIGLTDDRITRIEGNFWDIGEGPSGPNTEIFYDRGEAYGQNDPAEEMYPGGENERYLEIWNLVFSEFNHNPDHTYSPLPKQNIDTGMGLERMASVSQNVRTNFDTDLFLPIIQETERISGAKYGENEAKDVAFKVIADHIRTVAFAIGDGALPSNEGRGYVLRRLLRRAVRFAQQLNINQPFMYHLVDIVAAIMKAYYPSVEEQKDFIKRVIKSEEDRFHETLEEGLVHFNRLKETADGTLKGEDVFKLYDTFGFPVELTEELAEENGLKVDHAGFEKAMEEQRTRARESRQKTQSMQVQNETLSSIQTPSRFVGYDVLETTTELEDILVDGTAVQEAESGDVIQFILRETPFYAVSGGQIADTGLVSHDDFEIAVTEVIKAPNGQNLHTGTVKFGRVHKGATVLACVNKEFRNHIIKNHSATHLMHAALKQVLGTHVNQAGSLVTPDRLRFDFSHFGPVTQDELKQVESIVNQKIWANIKVNIEEMAIADAKEKGAMALFGEKYGDIVRVVEMSQFSIELCGGVHVQNTSEIGLFKIVSESGTGAGVRRIEAVTGQAAFEFLTHYEQMAEQLIHTLKVKNAGQIEAKVEDLVTAEKTLTKELSEAKRELSNLKVGDITTLTEDINGIRVLALEVEAADAKELRDMMDDYKSKLPDTLIFLAAASDKLNYMATVAKSLTDRVKAGDLIKGVANVTDGKGGGRPDSAQGGSNDTSKVTEALQFVKEHIKSL
ncbi:alanine--tRNA ligase [Macrococcus hajekii]|uniref:Alanine--tRNA ligase n=1 Tax=Macrococcus hajekii TaxID=198482 RepID=A0A4R6BM05_9STAP|nr:alanine--tRNA ligase [Macrococcus hajekii]TDM02840.1 alanine--tRNA ligase [Macrococcus hajekii]GGB04310.1 alanine--tRNA ligase [Macrococcus hajekii]